MKKLQVLLVDDHHIFRDGIMSLFSDVDDIIIGDVAQNGQEAIDKAKSLKPDVIILDISMPDMSGIEVLEKLRDENIETRVLVLSMHTKEEYIFKAIRAGATGYLPKEETTREELTKAIRDVASGKEYYSQSISRIMQSHFLNEAKNKKESSHTLESLTKREKEVLKLVVEGLTNSEIAEKLFVNIRTVETHKTNILQKLELKNSVELVKFAIKNNLMEI